MSQIYGQWIYHPGASVILTTVHSYRKQGVKNLTSTEAPADWNRRRRMQTSWLTFSFSLLSYRSGLLCREPSPGRCGNGHLSLANTETGKMTDQEAFSLEVVSMHHPGASGKNGNNSKKDPRRKVKVSVVCTQPSHLLCFFPFARSFMHSFNYYWAPTVCQAPISSYSQ